ncbi:hypothetical protein [Streptomyces lydicus]|uniref:hypothetical protein n=1 Tax=Streptomyces lydicus TaxID=47763 RepID=UPI00131D8CCD|nr:hypothetical protein [Streptomyces lydicus]
MYFSEQFGIEYLNEYDWFDPILERDTLLFVDPFLIFSDPDENWKMSHDEIMDYFQRAFVTLAKSGLRKQHQFYKRTLTLMEFPEPPEFRLGFASKNANGSGSGPEISARVVEAMSEAIKRGMQDIEHFEELGVLVQGINRDRISDITCNLLKPKLIKYTQSVCHGLGIPMQEAVIRHSRFDEMRQRWVAAEQLVPVDPAGKPILLVPKRFLRELPTLSSSNWGDFLDTSIRDDLNMQISGRMRKADIVAIARRRPEVIREWVRAVQQEGSRPYDTDLDPKLYVKWQKVARNATEEAPLVYEAAIQTPRDLLDFAHVAIAKFRHWTEEKGGWRVFWRDVKDGKAIPEPNMQLLFLGVLDGYCKRAGVILDREVETGRGPVDFTFTSAGNLRILLEMKKLSHGDFWNGLKTQTPIYMASQEINHAIFLTVRDSETPPMQKRWKSLEDEAKIASRDCGKTIEVSRIDILPKDSASKSS